MLRTLLAHADDDPQTAALAARRRPRVRLPVAAPVPVAALLDRDPDRPAIVVAGDDRAARDLAAALRSLARAADRPLLPEPRRHLRVAPGAAAAPGRAADRRARRAARRRDRRRGAGRRRQRRRAVREGARSRRCARTASRCGPASCSTSTRPRGDLVAAGLRARRPGRGPRPVRDPRRPARRVPGDRGPRRARRPVRRRDRVAALVLDLHPALARRRRGASRSRPRPSSPRSTASWPRSPRSRTRRTAPTSPSCCRSRTSTRSWSSRPADARVLIAGEEDVAPALADHWQDVTRRVPRRGRPPPVRRPPTRSRRARASAPGSACRASTRTSRSRSAPRPPTSPRAASRRPSPSSRSSPARATGPSSRSRAAARASGPPTTSGG